MAWNVNTITAITDATYHGTFPNLWMNQHPLYKYLHAKGPKLDGGERIKTPVVTAKMPTAMFGDGEEFTVTRVEFARAVFNNWKQGRVDLMYTGLDRLRNSGKAAIKSQIKSMVQNGADSWAWKMTVQLYARGAIGAKDINSLDLICNDSSNTLGAGTAYGDIDKSTETELAGTLYSGGGASKSPDYAMHSKGWAKVHDGLWHPDVIIENSEILQLYIRTQQPQQQFGSQKELDAGFFTATFNKIATIFGDLNAPYDTTTHANNRIWMVNTKHLDLISHQDENFRLEPFVRLQKQDAFVGYYLWAGNLVSDAPKRHCVIHNFDCDYEA